MVYPRTILVHWPRLMYHIRHRHLRSANNNLLFVPKTHLHYGAIMFTVSGSVNIFKKNLKTHLFTQTLD